MEKGEIARKCKDLVEEAINEYVNDQLKDGRRFAKDQSYMVYSDYKEYKENLLDDVYDCVWEMLSRAKDYIDTYAMEDIEDENY